MSAIFRTQIPTVKRLPQQCRNVISKAFAKCLTQCCSAVSEEAKVRAWKRQFMFWKCICRMQPQVRGGRKKKMKRMESLRAALLDRLARWNRGEYAELWEEACSAYAVQRPAREASEEGNIRLENVRRMLGTGKLLRRLSLHSEKSVAEMRSCSRSSYSAEWRRA